MPHVVGQTDGIQFRNQIQILFRNISNHIAVYQPFDSEI